MNEIERVTVYVIIGLVTLFLIIALSVAARDLLWSKTDNPPSDDDAGASAQRSAKTLNRFFKANLSQLRVMFWASLMAMALGLLVTTGVVVSGAPSEQKIIAAVLGAIGQFVAITFLAAYRSTVNQSLQFTQTLERLSNITTALNLIDNIRDETLRDSIRADTAKILASTKLQASADGAATAPKF